MKKWIKIAVALLFVVAFYFAAGNIKLPAPELRTEIEADCDWFHGDSIHVYRAGTTYFVDWDRFIDAINYEETMLTFGYLVGCAARSLPDQNGNLCMRTLYVDCTIPLRDCVVLYHMSEGGHSEEDVCSYMDSVVVFTDR